MNSIKWRIVLIVLPIVLFGTTSHAQMLRLDTLITQTVSAHPSILAAKAQKDIRLKQIEQSAVGENPELEVSIGQKRDSTSSGIAFETAVVQPILLSEKVNSRKSLARMNVVLQELEIKKINAALHYQIIGDAYEWQRYTEQFELNQNQIKKLNWIKRYITSRPFVSPQKRVEIRLIESRLKELEFENIRLASQKNKARAALKTVTSYPFPDEFNLILPKLGLKNMPTLAQLSLKVASENLDLQIGRAELEKVAIETAVLQAEAQPNVSLFGRYVSETASETEQLFSVGVGVELPFTAKAKFSVQAQAHRRDMILAQLTQLTREKETELQTALIQFKEAQDVSALYDDAWITQLEHSVDDAIRSFEKGQTELLSVLELESKWYEALIQKQAAQSDLLAAWAVMMQLTNSINLPGEF